LAKTHDENKTRGEEMLELLGKVWAEVLEKQLANTGIDHAVYDCGDIVFAGLELTSPPDETRVGLVSKTFTFAKYAYWKHVGPYSGLADAYQTIQRQLADLGYTATCPSMEIYGHWTDDERRLETEIFLSVR
jgi:predicted transcriptional regulator YdeE